MMAGVIPGAAKKDDEKKLLPVTPLGPLHEDSPELERVPVRGLTITWRHHKSRQPITRRDALCRIGNGFGMLAFASLVGESIVARGRPVRAGRRARSAQARSSGARQARHLPVHERRLVAGRQLRSEADARQVPRPAAARRHGRDRAQDRRADAVAVHVQEVRPVRASRSASCSRTSASASTTSASSARCTPTSRTTSRRC